MQDKINSFNAAFVDLAAAYVRRLANKIAGNETYTAEPPTGPLRWGTSLADEMRVVNLLAATIGKMQAASGGELPQGSPADGKPHAADNLEFLRDFLEGKTRWTFPEGTTINVTVDASGIETTQKGAEKEPPAGPEHVTLGPGTSFRMENTPASGPRVAEDSKKTDILLALKELCRWSKSKEDGGDSRWKRYTETLKFAISVLSELEEIREVRIQAQTDTPGAWELMRDILAGKRPAPEGTVFDVVIDVTGNPQAIRRREEAEAAPRMLAISMPGGETVKLNSAAEAYKLAGCIEEMAARVWPEAAPGK